MKTDLATAIVAAIIGLVLAFFVTNLMTGEIKPFSYTTIDESVNIDLSEPNSEVFNYRALNPTIEVYIGSCIEYNSNGECVEILTEEPDNNEGQSEETDIEQENF